MYCRRIFTDTNIGVDEDVPMKDTLTVKAILFDWGDTIMKVFPEYPGPMAHWPSVAMVEGADDLLRKLRDNYLLALLTNAGDSGSGLVVDALTRVDLQVAFDYVFTAKDLGSKKPEAAFFQAALGRMGVEPDEAVMVGDDFDKDIVGARKAGLRAVWFNPEGKEAPRSHDRAADAVIGRLGELEDALKSMR